MRQISEPTHVGLFASQLFGIKPNEPETSTQIAAEASNNWLKELAKLNPAITETKAVNEPQNYQDLAGSIPLFSDDKATRKAVFTGNLNENPIKSYLPYIDSTAFSATMDNFRIYIAQHNECIRIYNEQIKVENAEIDKLATTGLTEVQITFRDIFIKKHKTKKAEDYNKLVDEFNSERGLLVKKKPLQKVKYATELVFQQLLHVYSTQLAMYSCEYMKLNINEAAVLKKMDLNAHFITKLTRNGEKSIDVCKQTIRNHRAILENCGVLVNYQFRGNKKGVKMHINSQILTVFDAKLGKYVGAENQSLNPETFKDFKDNKEITRTFKRNIKKRENGQADFQILGTPSADLSICFLQEHSVANKQFQTGGAAENVKVSLENLEKTILNTVELAKRLSSGDFNNYIPIDIRFLHREAMYGTLTREEFNEIIIQDFFKTAAKYYKKHSVYVGSWKTAIQSWLNNRFWTNNGSGKHLYNKQLMVDLLEQYRWRLKNSENFYRKTKINRLFPSDYFDFTRKTKQEIGFEYTEKSWSRHIDYLNNEPELKKRAKRKTEKRLTNNSYAKKYDLILQRFFKNKVSFEQLYDYVKENLPSNFMQKLSEVVSKTASKYQC